MLNDHERRILQEMEQELEHADPCLTAAGRRHQRTLERMQRKAARLHDVTAAAAGLTALACFLLPATIDDSLVALTLAVTVVAVRHLRHPVQSLPRISGTLRRRGRQRPDADPYAGRDLAA